MSDENRMEVAVQLGIITDGDDLTQQAIDNFFEQNQNHPDRFMFGIDVELPVNNGNNNANDDED